MTALRLAAQAAGVERVIVVATRAGLATWAVGLRPAQRRHRRCWPRRDRRVLLRPGRAVHRPRPRGHPSGSYAQLLTGLHARSRSTSGSGCSKPPSVVPTTCRTGCLAGRRAAPPGRRGRGHGRAGGGDPRRRLRAGPRNPRPEGRPGVNGTGASRVGRAVGCQPGRRRSDPGHPSRRGWSLR
jgi:hypothetical protein